MNQSLLLALGGLGLFLMGMASLTEGLRSLAGGRLALALRRSTATPARGALTGLLTTIAVQSSSATTVIAVGFAGAGLLTFAQSLGIVFGANLGSTFTGWLVAALGFKLDLDRSAPLLVFLGMSLRLLGKQRWRAAGTALAGFGLLFTGLGLLQDGVAGIDLWPRPESLPPSSWGGRLALVGLGLLLTLITQASSAGVAMSIAALSAGQIDLAQAGALVIGMDVGTTVTALAASIGNSLEARRTALAHVVFNVFTALAALLLLSPYLGAMQAWAPTSFARHPEFVLVGFHSGFNLLGVLVVLPLTRPFARLVERLLPAENGRDGLDRGLLKSPHAAIETAAANLRRLAALGLRQLVAAGRGAATPAAGHLERDLASLRRFLLELETDRDHGIWHQRHVELLEAQDHLERALRRSQPRCSPEDLRRGGPEGEQLRESGELCSRQFLNLAEALDHPENPKPKELRAHWQQMVDQEPALRLSVLRTAVADRLDDALALALLDEARRLRRLLYHALELSERIGPYSDAQRPGEGAPPAPREQAANAPAAPAPS